MILLSVLMVLLSVEYSDHKVDGFAVCAISVKYANSTFSKNDFAFFVSFHFTNASYTTSYFFRGFSGNKPLVVDPAILRRFDGVWSISLSDSLVFVITAYGEPLFAQSSSTIVN